MPSIVLPRREFSQPANTGASDLALSAGCGSLLLPTSSGWSDALGMLSPTGKTGTPTTVANASGVARSYASSADFFLDSGLLDPTAGYAWLIHGTLVSSGGNWGGLIARTSDNTTTAGWAWQKDGSGNFVVYHGSSSNYMFGSMAGLVDGLPHTLIGLWRPSRNAVELWRDGLLVGSGTLTTLPVWSAGAGQIKLFSSRDTAAFTGTASLLALFTDGIESGTAERLSANPWQLFGGKRVLYFDAGGASGVNLSGTAAAQAGANADLTVQTAHDLAGDAAAQASAAGALIINSVFAESQFAAANNTDLAAAEAGWTRTALMGLGYLGVDANQLYGASIGTSALYVRNEVAPLADYTVELAVSAMAANLGGSTVGVVGRYVGEQYYGARYAGAAGQYELFKFELFGSGTTTLGSFAASIANGATVTIGLRMVGDEIAALVDGVAVIEVTDAAVVNPGQAGAFAVTGNPAHWRADNFQAVLIASGTGTVDLAAAAAAQPAASAGLTLAVPLAGAGIAIATAGGAMSVGIPLAGAAQALSAASGAIDVTTSNALSGNATATANATGGLSLSIPLSGSAVAQALASAGIAHGVPLAGNAQTLAHSAAALTLNVSLSGSAIAEALASAALDIGVKLSGDATAAAVASGGLETAGLVNLSGAAIAEAVADAALAHGVPLSGAAIAAAVAAAGLSQGVSLSGAAAAEALAGAGLALSTALAANATATATASGGLVINVSLSGVALAEAAASAGLTTANGASLSGNAAASASATAALTHAIPLSGASLAVSSASGNLIQMVPLSGSAASAGMATGGLDVQVRLSGAALAQALASAGVNHIPAAALAGAALSEALAQGNITLRVNLEGAAVAQAIAAGALNAYGLLTTASKGWKIAAVPRSWSIAQPSRSWDIGQPARNWRVQR